MWRIGRHDDWRTLPRQRGNGAMLRGGQAMVGDGEKRKRGRPSKAAGKPMLAIVPDTTGKVIRFAAGQGKDSNGLTVKQELFCQEVAKGSSLSAAYRVAYNSENMKPNIVNNEACKLMARRDIADRVNTIIAENQAKSSHDSARIKQHVIEKLWLESQDTKNPATVRVRALELLGKMTTVSLFTDRVMTETIDARSPEDIEQQIKDKLAKLAG
jgi:hypothetical protein